MPERDEPTERLTSAAVAPDSVEQVQQIVRIANEHKIPLYPISTGKNLGYGGSAPILSGSVVGDLLRMNKFAVWHYARANGLAGNNHWRFVYPGRYDTTKGPASADPDLGRPPAQGFVSLHGLAHCASAGLPRQL